MKRLLTIFLTTILAANSIGQDTIWVKGGDKKYMYPGSGEWLFKENLPDGHYCSYDVEKGVVSVEVDFKNKKKEGIENRYYAFGSGKYATVHWANGKKNGLETHYNGNKTIQHALSFKDGVLNGPFEINWSEGAKNYKGFYKNGFRDSIWIYYDHYDSRIDSANYWISEEYKYDNGKKLLVSAWDKVGAKTINNGSGVLIEDNYYKTTTDYKNGKKNGKQVVTNSNGTLYCEGIYKDGLLTNETLYYDSNRVASISEWSYPTPPRIDTAKEWIDTYITDIFYNAISYEYFPVPNGKWLANYRNMVKIYEGNYNNGNRVGKWNWHYKNGKQRMDVDYSTNTWQHFDTTGKLISNISTEFLTDLTTGYWFLNQKLDRPKVTFTKQNNKTVTPRFVFHYDGVLEINSFLECGKDIGESLNSYNILGNTLIISVPDKEKNDKRVYKFKIISATSDKIIMQKIK